MHRCLCAFSLRCFLPTPPSFPSPQVDEETGAPVALGPVHLRDGGSRFVPMFGPDAFCRPTRAKGLGKAKAAAQKPTASTAPHASVKDRVELRRGVPPSRATPVLIWSAHGGAAHRPLCFRVNCAVTCSRLVSLSFSSPSHVWRSTNEGPRFVERSVGAYAAPEQGRPKGL
jgi:hypothetical protein